MNTLNIDSKTFQTIGMLAHRLRTSENAIVQQAVRYYATFTESEPLQASAGETRQPKLLQHGRQRPLGLLKGKATCTIHSDFEMTDEELTQI